jgi:hypothetical protein
MIQLHGDVSLFTMQGLEKLNDFTTQHYFNSTNRQTDYLFQLIRKRNRIETMNVYEQSDFFDTFSKTSTPNPNNNRNK